MENITMLLKAERAQIADRRKEIEREMRDLDRAETRLERIFGEVDAVEQILNGERRVGRPTLDRQPERNAKYNKDQKVGMTGVSQAESRQAVLDLFTQGKLDPDGFWADQIAQVGPFKTPPTERVHQLIDRGFIRKTGRKCGPRNKATELALTEKGRRKTGLTGEPVVESAPKRAVPKTGISAQIMEVLQSGPMYGPDIQKALSGSTGSTVRSNISHLVEAGKVRLTGNERKPVAGPFMAKEYELVAAKEDEPQRIPTVRPGEGLFAGRRF